MPYRICKTFEIESGHILSKHPDKCAFPHGHTRKVEFVLEAGDLDENDMVCDFKVIKELMTDFLDTLDHAMCVNTADPGYKHLQALYGERIIKFENEDPTTEVIAKLIYDHFKNALREYASGQTLKAIPYDLRANLRIVKVRLWETNSSWAEYWEDPPATTAT
ncbi:MAG: 6-carboxytetrahydropterin synthase [Verrucomicrobia bacterium]|nr:6-carboxytetrahydropterin synthase [Verrucomicrobiota bacterium]